MGQRHDDEDDYDFRQRRPGRRFRDEGDDRGQDQQPARRGDDTSSVGIILGGLAVTAADLAPARAKKPAAKKGRKR
jgi:hypothetical protein